MAARAFGRFLIDKGLITLEQLSEALELQLAVNPLIGDLVVAAGWMTPAQVEEVNLEQRNTDKRFGELCLERGYLEELQVEELLDHQRAKRRLLGQLLLDLDFVDQPQLEDAIQEHAAELRGAQNVEEPIALGDAKLSELARVAVEQLTRQYLRIIKRPMGLAAVLPPSQNQLPQGAHWVQQVSGEDRFALCLVADEDVGVEIAAAFTDGQPDYDGETFACEAIGTFLNLVAGHVCADVGEGKAPYHAEAPVFRPQIDRAEQEELIPVFTAVMDAGGRKVDFLLARTSH